MLTYTDEGSLIWDSQAQFPLPIVHILDIEADNQGNVFLAAMVQKDAPAVAQVALISPTGVQQGTFQIPTHSLPGLDTFKPLTIDPQGRLITLTFHPEGAQISAIVAPHLH